MAKKKYSRRYEKLGNFEPRKIGSKKDTIIDFANGGIHQDLSEVPGLRGNVNIGILKMMQEPGDFPVTTTSQLLGLYLCCKGPHFTPKQHADVFYKYIQMRGITVSRDDIVMSMAMLADGAFGDMIEDAWTDDINRHNRDEY